MPSRPVPQLLSILTTEELAAWFQLSTGVTAGLPLPRLALPGRTVRYLAGQVLESLGVIDLRVALAHRNNAAMRCASSTSQDATSGRSYKECMDCGSWPR